MEETGLGVLCVLFWWFVCLFGVSFLASVSTGFHWLRISEGQDGFLLIRFISQRLVIEDVKMLGQTLCRLYHN